MFGKYKDLVEKVSEIGLKSYFLDAKNIPIENRTALKCAYGCKDMELGRASHLMLCQLMSSGRL